ncbi:MAG: GWxTD domain-containing protein [Bacteroidota bacterium]
MITRIAVMLFFCTGRIVFGQVEALPPSLTNDLPEFYVEALSFSSSDTLVSRVDLYVQMPYAALQFVKKDNQFVGRYEVTTNFLSAENVLHSERLWSEEVIVPQFDLTRSKSAFNLSHRSVNLQPGIYTLRTQVRDLESQKVATVVRKIVVGNYYLPDLALSDIMLVTRMTLEGDRRNILPNISGNIGENNNLFNIFFEIYTPRERDSIELHYTITDFKGKQLLDKFQTYETAGRKTQVITRLDSTQYQTGAYTISVEARSLIRPDEVLPAIKKKGFFVRWGNMPLSITDLDLAIKQARYIAKDNEFAAFENADTDEKKRALFDEFWKRRDPNPATSRNEFMEEYYSRVDYANKNFSHYIPGWRTDMGMVFIIFGSPNNVERHPFDIDSKPYEIWSYYDFNRSVVFVDETGFGDYRLLTPIWDMIQRLKR